ncbi:hypothetical protein Poly51_58420 [Rubripirellula tenax]|uniref:Uncharacterized protein n=2 Tax=Rubripirellula tenax TaxID=2528015 RepID=A0A5C6EBA2_9BACT|nr:hypothetical protein Poly51_58420 [Rubripirellula tenax]
MMEQCYSGGMLGELQTVYSQKDIKASLMSAAKFEVSWAADTEGEGAIRLMR